MKYEIIKKERIFNEFFKVDRAEVKHECFNSDSWNHVKRYGLERPEAVAILLENTSSETIIMVEQFRFSTVDTPGRDGWALEIVAGLIDKGETPEESAIRETYEEVGYQINYLEHLYTYFASIGISDERVHIFYSKVTDADKIAVGGGLENENEDLAIREIPFQELQEMLTEGKIADSKTIIALQWLALKKSIEA